MLNHFIIWNINKENLSKYKTLAKSEELLVNNTVINNANTTSSPCVSQTPQILSPNTSHIFKLN